MKPPSSPEGGDFVYRFFYNLLVFFGMINIAVIIVRVHKGDR